MRRKDREVIDIQEILQIVRQAKILHLGLFDGAYPYIVPLHYGYDYAENALVFYMHGAKEGHKIDLIRANPNVCVELECNTELVSGGDVPCKYGSTFASVIGQGTITLVEDEQEKIRGLELLMKNQTGQEFAMNRQMAASVEVIKVTVCDFTAKARNFQKLER